MSYVKPGRLVLSRKGFDSGAGRYPNIIYEDKLYFIPIPEAGSDIFYKDLQFDPKTSYLKVMRDLGIREYSEGHLDPDIRSVIYPHLPPNWRPSLGQKGASLSHLRSEGVGEGDLFLFWGWFKQVYKKKGKFCYEKNSPDLHVVFGYLQVDVFRDLTCEDSSDLSHHPHYIFRDRYNPVGNGLFIATDRLSFLTGLPGAGMLTYRQDRVLTCTSPYTRRSEWLLPACFFDTNKRCKLTYHQKKQGLPHNELSGYKIKSASRGQEFVISIDKPIQNWILSILI